MKGQKMEMFKRSSIFENERCGIKNQLREKEKTLTTERGKEQARINLKKKDAETAADGYVSLIDADFHADMLKEARR